MFEITNKFSIIFNYLPLKECVTLSFDTLEFTSPNEALSQVWLKLAQTKDYLQTDRQKDRLTVTVQKSSLKLSAQVS